MSQPFDLSGNDIVVDNIYVGASTPGSAGTLLSGSNAPPTFSLTASTVGASVDGADFIASTEVALGTYANAMNGKLNFGTAGRVTGLGSPICAELDLGPGTTQGSYACFEAELNVPTSGSLGTRTSFITLNAWGANVAAFDTSGFLFDLNGITAGSSKLLEASTKTGIAKTHTLRIQINGTTYYLPLNTSSTFGGS